MTHLSGLQSGKAASISRYLRPMLQQEEKTGYGKNIQRLNFSELNIQVDDIAKPKMNDDCLHYVSHSKNLKRSLNADESGPNKSINIK